MRGEGAVRPLIDEIRVGDGRGPVHTVTGEQGLSGRVGNGPVGKESDG